MGMAMMMMEMIEDYVLSIQATKTCFFCSKGLTVLGCYRNPSCKLKMGSRPPYTPKVAVAVGFSRPLPITL